MSIVWCLKVFVSILRRAKTRRCFCFRGSIPLLSHGDYGSVIMSITRNTATWSKTVHCPITWDQALVKVLWLKVRRRPPLATLPHAAVFTMQRLLLRQGDGWRMAKQSLQRSKPKSSTTLPSKLQFCLSEYGLGIQLKSFGYQPVRPRSSKGPTGVRTGQHYSLNSIMHLYGLPELS